MTLLERAVFGSITPLFTLKSNSDHTEWITSFYLLIYLNSVCVRVGGRDVCSQKPSEDVRLPGGRVTDRVFKILNY